MLWCKMPIGFELRTRVSMLSSKFFNFMAGCMFFEPSTDKKKMETSTSTDRRQTRLGFALDGQTEP